jgi:hypothetical protein
LRRKGYSPRERERRGGEGERVEGTTVRKEERFLEGSGRK